MNKKEHPKEKTLGCAETAITYQRVKRVAAYAGANQSTLVRESLKIGMLPAALRLRAKIQKNLDKGDGDRLAKMIREIDWGGAKPAGPDDTTPTKFCTLEAAFA